MHVIVRSFFQEDITIRVSDLHHAMDTVIRVMSRVPDAEFYSIQQTGYYWNQTLIYPAANSYAYQVLVIA